MSANHPPKGVHACDPLTLQGLIAHGRVAANPESGATGWHMCNLIKQMLPHLKELAELKKDYSVFDERYNGERGCRP